MKAGQEKEGLKNPEVEKILCYRGFRTGGNQFSIAATAALIQ